MSDKPILAYMSQAAFSRLMGVSRASVSQWKIRGLVVLQDDMETGLVDVVRSQALLKAYRMVEPPVVIVPPVQEQPPAEDPDEITDDEIDELNAEMPQQTIRRALFEEGDSAEQVAANILSNLGIAMDYLTAKTMKENYLALMNQLKYDRESALVVSAAEVAAAVGAEYATVRTRLLAIPAEHAERIHRLKTVQQIQDSLLETITEALEGLTADAAPASS